MDDVSREIQLAATWLARRSLSNLRRSSRPARAAAAKMESAARDEFGRMMRERVASAPPERTDVLITFEVTDGRSYEVEIGPGLVRARPTGSDTWDVIRS